METTKKRGILPAIFFLLTAFLQVANTLRGYQYQTDFPLRAFWGIAAGIAIAVVLIMGKRSLPVAICAGVWTLLSLYNTFSNLQPDWEGNIRIMGVFTSFLGFGVWAILTFVLLIDMLPTLENFKSKKTLLGKIFLGVYILYAVLAVVNSVPNTFLIYWAPNIITLVAIFTFALWISPAPQKEYSAQSTSSAAPSANEFYVSIGKHVCLLLFTFGIWQLIWIYKTTKFTNLVTDEPARDPATKLLLCMFIPFYQIYWTYKTAMRIDKIAKQNGMLSDLGTACLILAIFVAFIPPILMQDKINQIIVQTQNS